MNTMASSGGILNQPAATHSGSPMIGSQDSNSTGLPQRRTRSIARCRVGSSSSALWPNLFTKYQPISHEVMPPSVLPIVAMPSRLSSLWWLLNARAINSASEPPGSRVDDRNALTNKPQAPHSVSHWFNESNMFGDIGFGSNSAHKLLLNLL